MTFREWNRRKNLYLRGLKAKAGKFLFDKKNPNRFTPHQLKTIKKIVFLRNDNKLGDMIVNTAAFREIKKALPKAEITVIAGPASAQIIENNRNISQIMICKKGIWPIIKTGLALRRQKIDLYIDMDRQPTFDTLLLLRLIKPRFSFGFNREGFKAYNLNCKLDLDGSHITAWHQAMLRTLRLEKPESLSYDLFVPNALKKEALKYFAKLTGAAGNIALNAFAASKHRCLSEEQVKAVAQAFPKHNIILLGRHSQTEPLINRINAKNVFPAPQDTLFMNFAVLAASDLLITPDTAFAHAAAALDKKQVCLYKESDKANQKVWAPLSDKAVIIQTPDEFSELPPDIIINAARQNL